jgi:branched-chain amino acid transport system ATP-binding protein
MIRESMRYTLAQNNSYLLEVKDLTVHYGNILAVDGIALGVRKGEIVTLIGANGAGKSTVLKGILGIQRASRGTISFMGREISRAATDKIVASGIAIVPEGRGIVAEMTILENLELGAFHRKDEIKSTLKMVFEKFPILAERQNQYGGTLSGGQQQMLAIARAMMAKPVLIMMDEPSLGLAPIVVKSLFEDISQLREEGQTILLAEQNAKMALKMADRGYVFEKGQVVLNGSKQDLVDNEKVRQAYLGG